MSDHCVLEYARRPPLLRCLECGDTHEVKLPMAITELVKLFDQFKARHRACKRRQVGIQIAQPEPPAEALAARPLLEQVARMGDRIGQHTVGEIMAISDRAAAWLQENSLGQGHQPAPPAEGEVQP